MGQYANLFLGQIYGTALTAATTSQEVMPEGPIFGIMPPSGTPVSASNDFGLSGNVSGNVLVAEDNEGGYYIVQAPASGGTRLAGAVLSATMSNSSSTVAISSITPYDGSTVSGVSSVSNPRGHAAANGATVVVLENKVGGTWDVIDAPLVDVTNLTPGSGSISGTNIVFPTQQIAAETDGAAGTANITGLVSNVTAIVGDQFSGGACNTRPRPLQCLGPRRSPAHGSTFSPPAA